MAEYIERETVMKIIDDYGCTHGGTLGSHSGAVDVVGSAIYKLPAADVAPVKHGHWEEIRDAYGQLEGWMCKKCGREMKAKENYCPNCGAKMDGGENS